MKRILLALSMVLFASAAQAVDNPLTCTGASCKVVLAPRTSGGTATTVMTASTSAVTVAAGVNVGLGTSSPNNYAGYANLAINGSTGGNIDYMAGGVLQAELAATTGSMTMATNTAIPLIFQTNNSEAMRILSGGKVGIGMTAPLMPLTVRNTSAGPATSGTTPNGMFRIDSGNNSNVMDMGDYGTAPFGSWIQVTDRTNLASTYPLTLQPNGGSVGIGSANPSYTLDVNGYARASSGLIGSGTSASACAGCIGEVLTASVLQQSETGYATGTVANITTITLTAGDWDVRGNCHYDGAAGGQTLTYLLCAVSTTSATEPSYSLTAGAPFGSQYTGIYRPYTAVADIAHDINIPSYQVLVANGSTQQLWLVEQVNSSSTAYYSGYLQARRMH